MKKEIIDLIAFHLFYFIISYTTVEFVGQFMHIVSYPIASSIFIYCILKSINSFFIGLIYIFISLLIPWVLIFLFLVLDTKKIIDLSQFIGSFILIFTINLFIWFFVFIFKN